MGQVDLWGKIVWERWTPNWACFLLNIVRDNVWLHAINA
jgi:hypothetical protein